MLFGLLVGCSDFGVKDFLLFVFFGVFCCSVFVVISMLPNCKAEISKVSQHVWIEECQGVFVLEVSDGVVSEVCLEPCRGISTTE